MVGADVAEAIARVLAAQDAAWCAGDAAAFGASAMDDILFTNVIGMFAVGIEPFVAQHAHIFATVYAGSRLAQEIVRITPLGDDVAIVDTLTAVTGFRNLPPGTAAIGGALRTRLEQVLVRREGAWCVQSFHNVSIQPAAMPGMVQPRP